MAASQLEFTVSKFYHRSQANTTSAAPDAAETISYGMSAFRLNGILVYFGIGKAHIGFSPRRAVKARRSQPIPFDLIADIVKFRVAEK